MLPKFPNTKCRLKNTTTSIRITVAIRSKVESVQLQAPAISNEQSSPTSDGLEIVLMGCDAEGNIVTIAFDPPGQARTTLQVQLGKVMSTFHRLGISFGRQHLSWLLLSEHGRLLTQGKTSWSGIRHPRPARSPRKPTERHMRSRLNKSCIPNMLHDRGRSRGSRRYISFASIESILLFLLEWTLSFIASKSMLTSTARGA